MEENDTFLITCKIGENSYQTINRFPNEGYERKWIAMLVIVCMLLFSTIILNGISIITIRKSSQLRSKVCYFVILLQTIVDLGVGVLSIPIFIYHLLSPFLSTAKCTLLPWVLGTTYLPCALSMITQSAMTLERYIGVLHPYYYETQVTKKRILAYVCGGCCALFTIIFLSRDRSIHRIFWGVMILTFFCFTAFVYTRIYLVIRKLVRSPKKPVSCESTDANQNVTKRQIFRESRHARACFAVVVCFGIFLLPLVLVMVFFNISSTMFYLEYVHWSITSMIFNSTINSLIFFWTNPLLRKEAFRTLRLYYS
jgi:hypothetical protein